jgi:cGMP-dependent protein kinase
VLKNDVEVRKLHQYESFGEQALLNSKQVRQMTIKASENCILLALGRDIIIKILGDQVQSIIYRNIAKWALERSDVFGKLNLIQIEKILDLIQKRHFKSDDVIYSVDQPIDRDIFILIEGTAKMVTHQILK